MALRFYFDTHIAKAVAEQLRSKNVDVLRCEEVGMASASDEEHLQYATDESRIMVSHDVDFPVIHSQWMKDGKRHAGIFKMPSNVQGQAQITLIVNNLVFYNDAEAGGAIDYATEIENTLIYF